MVILFYFSPLCIFWWFLLDTAAPPCHDNITMRDKLTDGDTMQRAYSHYGARHIDDSDVVHVGDILPPSRVWDDGEPTEDMLPGTSAVKVQHGWREQMRPYAWIGHRVLIIGSDHAEWGSDPGEIVMRDAVVIAIR